MADGRESTRFVWLLATLLAFYLIIPLFEHIRGAVDAVIPRFFEGPVFVLLLTAVLISVSRRKKYRSLTLTLGVIAALLWAVPSSLITEQLRLLRHGSAIAFLAYSIGSILVYIFTAHRVTSNLLCSSLCIYLLMGVLWAVAYSTVAIVNPAAFIYNVPGHAQKGMVLDSGTSAEALYFSYVTLTTLGYGDIVPGVPVTRSLATLEAIMGQLVLTVLVARLVGMHIIDSQNAGDNEQVSA
jgi:hypothetical protein